MSIALLAGVAMNLGSAPVEEWTASKLSDALSQKRELPADELARWFGESSLDAGANLKYDDLRVAFAIRTPSPRASVVTVPPGRRFSLVKLPSSDLHVGVFEFQEGEAFRWTYEVDGKPVGAVRELEAYLMPPESRIDPRVPKGKLEKREPMTSQVFGGTKHDWWVYTPAKFDPMKESNLMVFQDGQWAHEYVPNFFDHLIQKGDLPQTVVVLVTPGTFPDGRSDRSREYDTLSSAYSRFLLEELLPPVETQFKITQDPRRRGVAGLSSGAICAFTVAWERPDKFGLVLSWIGSYTNIASGATLREGGHNYPAIIRKTPKKPIRVFLQEGLNDLDNIHGSWPEANRAMESSLRFMNYEVRSAWGNGFHSNRQGCKTMPDALRWLFKP